MNKTLDFITSEKDYFGKIFVDVSYAIDNITPFIDKKTLNTRKYIVKLPILEKYVELLNSAEAESSKKGKFLGLFQNDKYIDLLNDYKRKNKDSFDQLDKCSKCSCLNCSSSCSFNSCLGCRSASFINQCDHNKLNITVHDNFTLDLTNDRTGKADKYIVLATLQDCEEDKKYIVIKNVLSSEKFILYYYPGIVEDSYGEINNPEEFDLVVATIESVNI